MTVYKFRDSTIGDARIEARRMNGKYVEGIWQDFKEGIQIVLINLVLDIAVKVVADLGNRLLTCIGDMGCCCRCNLHSVAVVLGTFTLLSSS